VLWLIKCILTIFNYFIAKCSVQCSFYLFQFITVYNNYLLNMQTSCKKQYFIRIVDIRPWLLTFPNEITANFPRRKNIDFLFLKFILDLKLSDLFNLTCVYEKLSKSMSCLSNDMSINLENPRKKWKHKYHMKIADSGWLCFFMRDNVKVQHLLRHLALA
jgi:hypothetical protein